MFRPVSLLAAAAALVLAPAALAEDDAGIVPTADASSPVKLVSFDGEWELLKTSRQLRIWRSHLAYTINVDAEGNATECELTEDFRRTYVKQKLCEVLLKSHTFEPALDATATPVPGTYSARLSYLEMRERH